MAQVLNPVLYDRLVRVFGRVGIANEGEEYVPGPMKQDLRTGKLVRTTIHAGEYYTVCCPFCNDTDRDRKLWINYRWNTGPGTSNLAICFKASACLDDIVNREILFYKITYPIPKWEETTKQQLRKGRVLDPETIGIVQWPSRLHALTSLGDDHECVKYLRGRSFSVEYLSNSLEVRYCSDGGYFPVATRRMIIPMYVDQKCVGWQARMLVEPPEWAKTSLPKYFTLPGMKRNHCLYNYDRACRYKTMVVVEGPTDVWRVGENAVAVLGKGLSEPQADLIVRANPRSVVIALDPCDPKDPRGKEVGRLVNDAFEKLVVRPSLNRKLVRLVLPPDKDPGSMTHKGFWKLAVKAGRELGIEVFPAVSKASMV